MDLQSCRYQLRYTIGSDFLSFYGLKVDSSCGRLLESQKCAELQSHAQTNSNFRPTKRAEQTPTIQVANQLIGTKTIPYKNSSTISKPQSFQNGKPLQSRRIRNNYD